MCFLSQLDAHFILQLHIARHAPFALFHAAVFAQLPYLSVMSSLYPANFCSQEGGIMDTVAEDMGEIVDVTAATMNHPGITAHGNAARPGLFLFSGLHERNGHI